MGINIHKGTIFSTDCFDPYSQNVHTILERTPKDIELIGAEMEAFGLFYIAKLLNKQAACLATVVDVLHGAKEEATAEERQNALNRMIEIALETALEL